MNPSLRPIEFIPVFHQNQQMWYLRDPLQLTEQQLTVPQALAQMLLLLNGERNLVEVHQTFCAEIGQDVPFDVVVDTVNTLDEACLLDNARAQTAKQKQIDAYRAEPFRKPALAGGVYAADKDALVRELVEYGAEDNVSDWLPWRGRGIISPHIDYQRGGSVYAKVWARAKQAVLDAELVIVLGTDHNGGAGTLTLTKQAYATPFGVLPTDDGLVNALAEAIGEDRAFGLELNHRQEHSVELSAVWLHHLYNEANIAPAPMLPVLVGSLYQFVQSGTHPDDDPMFNTFIETLKRETADKRTLIISSVDFAHVGPAFDDDYVMDSEKRDLLRQSDESLIEAIGLGDNGRFYSEIAAINNSNKLCGFSSIYLMLRYLGQTSGTPIAYKHCDADDESHSLVSICGMLLK